MYFFGHANWTIDEKSVVYSHSNEISNKFAVDVKERQDRLPTMYWLPKLHKRPYKASLILKDIPSKKKSVIRMYP